MADHQLVILGCGYVGSAVARAATRRGWDVTAVTRNPETAAELERQQVPVVVADLCGEDWMQRLPRRATCVLNTIGAGGGGLDGYRRSYVEGMKSMARWSQRAGGAATFVYTSSTAVYPQSGGEVVAETDAVAHDERAAVLLEAESLARAGQWRRCFVLRLAGIYGPGRHHLLDQVRDGLVTGHGGHHLNIVHRDDVVAAVLACFGAPASVASDVFNVADDEPAPKVEVAGWLAAQLGVASPVFSNEPHPRRRQITPDRLISNARIKHVLGWRPQFPSYRAGYAGLLEADRA